MTVRLFAAALLISGALAAPALAQDAPVTGEGLFNQKCKVCHNDTPTARGPHLKGIAGRAIASTEYAYSDALKAKGGKWTDANLDAYLTSPKVFAPGGKMPVGVADDAQRKLIITYIKTLK